MVTFFSPDRVTRTLPPGFSLIVFRIFAGITTCPLAEVFTMGIVVHLIVGLFNFRNKSITRLGTCVNIHSQPKHGVIHSVVSHNNERYPRPRLQ